MVVKENIEFPYKEQNRIDHIRKWLSLTSEPFDDWEYDGEELTLILDDKVIERYTVDTLKEFIEGF